MKKENKEIKLEINGQEDRRQLVGILAENGYKVKVVKDDRIGWEAPYRFVIIYLK